MLAYDEARKLMAEGPQSPLSQMALAMGTGLLPRRKSRPPIGRRPLAKARAAARQVRLQAPTFGDAYIPECLLSPRACGASSCEKRLRYALVGRCPRPLGRRLSQQLAGRGRPDPRSGATGPGVRSKCARSTRTGRPGTCISSKLSATTPRSRGSPARTDRYWPNRPQIAESAFLGRIARGAWGEAGDLLRRQPGRLTSFSSPKSSMDSKH